MDNNTHLVVEILNLNEISSDMMALKMKLTKILHDHYLQKKFRLWQIFQICIL